VTATGRYGKMVWLGSPLEFFGKAFAEQICGQLAWVGSKI
jgi:hypothetical protein